MSINFKVDWVSAERLRPYLAYTFDDQQRAVELYVLGRQLGAAIFHQIAYLEVALRNCMVEYLSKAYGEDWYAKPEVGFDERVRENLSEFWESLPKNFTRNAERGEKLGGRLVAASMFRTWTNMLDKGAGTGLPAPFDKADHDRIWTSTALRQTFKDANALAKKKDPNFQATGLTRDWVYRKVFPVRQIRNRIGHHESIAPKGVPITGADTRLSARECAEVCMDLAQMIDRDLATFLSSFPVMDLIDKLDCFNSSLNNQRS